MRRFVNFIFIVGILVSLAVALPAMAQEGKGAISGTVKDSQNGALTGALVEIQPTGKRVVSDNQGQYRISDVAAGEYNLTVSYVGFESFASTVKVSAGQTATLDPLLNVAAQTDQIIVTAERLQGETEAINIERTSQDIVQVLPLKVITSLPNTNVADAVGRLPSVTLERDEGEGKYVQIRGTEPRLTNMMVNGVELPSPEAQYRNIKMDAIPADLVDRIELSKTLSANQDADAIGGTVNLVTKTAGEKAYYSFDGQGGYTPIQGGRTLGGLGGGVGKRFGGKKQLGVFFGGSFDRNNRGIDDLEPGQAIGTDPATGNKVALINTEDKRTYEYYRTRYGFDSTLDYKLSPASGVYVKGFYSDFHDYGDVWVYTPNAGAITGVSGSTITFDGTGSSEYRHYIRRPDQQVFSFQTGARHDLSSTLINYNFAVSRGHNIGGQDFPSTYFALQNAAGTGPAGVQYSLDQSNPYAPRLNVADGTNVFDPTKYALDNTGNANYVSSFNRYHGTQLNFQGSASVARRYTVGSHFGTFELGFLGRNAHKYQIENDQLFQDNGSGIALSQVLGTYVNPNFYSPITIPVGPFSDYSKIDKLVRQAVTNGTLVLDTNQSAIKNAGATWDVNERVWAGYLMNDISFGRASLQAGVRFEATQANYLANAVDKTNPTVPVTTPGNNNYLNILPSVQFKYLLTPNTNVRASFGVGISRPNFQDQVTSQQIDPNASPKSIQLGNPALKATRANNYDVLVEHFFQPLGILQGGFFYKTLNDPIYLTNTFVIGGPFNGYLQQQSVNGPSAYIYGVEMAWEQRLSRLPGLLNGLGVSANYSYTTSRANFPAGFSPVKGSAQGRIDHPHLQRQAPNTWNLGFTYDKARFSMRFAVSHNDANIYAYQYQHNGTITNVDNDPISGIKGPLGDQYFYAHTQVDIQGSYRLYKGLNFIASGLNLTNEVFGFYTGSPIYPNQREFYHPSVIVGMRWTSSEQ